MSSKLKTAYMEEMKIAGKEMLNVPWERKEVYASWLAQTYHFVCHSTRIVAMAGAKFSYERNEFHLSSIEHLNQEKNHEKLLLMDLKNLGLAVAEIPKTLSSSILFQNQYYWIQNQNPISVYGYYLLLEGIAAEFGPKIYQTLKSHYPEKCLSFVRVHAEEDEGHIDEHLNKLNDLPSEEIDLIIQNLKQSSLIYQSILKEMRELASKNQNAKAA